MSNLAVMGDVQQESEASLAADSCRDRSVTVVVINGQRLGFRRSQVSQPPPLPKPARPPAFRIKVAGTDENARSSAFAWLRGWRGWVVSAGVHVLIILGMALFILGRREATEGVVLLGEPAADDTLLMTIEVKSLMLPNEVADTAAPRSAATEPALPTSESVTRSVPDNLARFSFVEGNPSGPIGDVMGLFGPGGHGMGEVQTGQGTEFFGVRATGNRFVFVVDCSKSMIGPRWRSAREELLATIEQLQPHQKFYVVFFDGSPHPMFSDRQPELEMVRANEENKQRLRRWMGRVSFGRVTDPLGSVQLAVKFKPDALFLLSDGEFHHHTADFLRRENRVEQQRGDWQVETVVHTIGFQSQDGELALRQIADENGGTYRYVP